MNSQKSTSELSLNTLFVRGIPPSCSNESLSEVFSKAGAIKECFVVKYKSAKSDTERPCIGYVTYTLPEDAKTAIKMEKELTIDENKLKISFARKKPKKKNKKVENKMLESDQNSKKVDDSEVRNEKKIQDKSLENSTDKDIDIEDSYTVVISGLPALYKKEHVLTLWKKCGLKEPKELVFPCGNFDEPEKEEETETDAKGRLQSAKFIVDSKQTALKAYNKLAGKIVGKKKNYSLKVNFLTPEGNFKAAKKSRLIIRNLSFQCTEDDLKQAFKNYGTITEVKIPTKPDGKKRGFAFIQFSHVFEAARAIKAMNMQEIKGRKVAIDWSLPKEKYKEMSSGQNPEEHVDIKNNDEEDFSDQDGSSRSGGEHETSSDSGLEDDESESNKETSDDETEEESENEAEDDEENQKDENPYIKPLKKASKNVKKLDPKSSHDVHEGRTVFIQNLSYDTTEEKVTEVLSEYGQLRYTKIVINRDTGMSKGCGFAQFETVDEAKRCIEVLGVENSGKIVDGREIKVVPALSRGETEKMRKDGKKKKEVEDKRNLYLGREGLIRPGTQAAEGLSEIELKKRAKMENAKRAKLRNPNVFISTTRLCFHNLPKSVDDAKLKQLLLNQFRDRRSVRITECRIMRDRANVNEQGVAQPLGYAFVNFAKHENALKALRTLNNNPEVFGPIKRPIVEFALENRKALQIKEQRKKKFLAKRKLREKLRNSGEQGDAPQEKVKKLGRRKRQNLKRQLEEGRNEKVQKRQKTDRISDSSMKKGPKKRKFNSEIQPKKMKSSEKSPLHERKPFQGSSGTTLSGKKLPLPAHAGPKIRQKNKGKILEQMRRSKKLNAKPVQRKLMKKFKNERQGTWEKSKVPKSDESIRRLPKRKKVDKEDMEFNALVAKYTKAFLSKTPKMQKTGDKWYES